MRRVILRLILVASLVGSSLLFGCSSKDDTVTFIAEIDSVSENSILVTTSDDVGFDLASVSYGENLKLDFTPEAGQIVEITIMPEIRESYPVQVTAVKIQLQNEDPDMITKTEYKKITAEEAKTIMDQEEDVIILDVRTQEEYEDGYIENAILLPDYEINDNAETILPDKNAKILVYCRSGNRSASSAKALIKMGYTDVYDFGGIIDWPYEN